MYIQLNNWSAVSVDDFSDALAIDANAHDVLFDTIDAEYMISSDPDGSNTYASGTEPTTGYQYTVEGNHFKDDSYKINYKSMYFYDSTDNKSYQFTSPGITVNYATQKITGSWRSLQYNDLSSNASYRLDGKFGFAQDGSMYSSTITSITYTSPNVADYTIKGKFYTTAFGNITDGTINEISFVDDANHTLKFNNINITWNKFQTLTQGQSDLTLLYEYLATESALAGNDVIESGDAGDTLNGYAGNDKLYGNGGDDTLIGGAGVDLLDGGSGEDTMSGGTGNDTYIVDDSNDSITELENQGLDSVRASDDFVLSNNLETLILTGSANINGTGNSLNNTITGNTGNNILEGAGGVDTLSGGAGNDTYVVDLILKGNKAVLQDKIAEKPKAGTDTVQLEQTVSLSVATTLVLGKNLENMDASNTGSTLLNLTGNKLSNILTGNDANNIIKADAGNDTLIGGLGADTLTGGKGSDSFTFTASSDSTSSQMDTITDFKSGEDTITFYQLNGNNQNLSFANTSASAYAVWYEQSLGSTIVYVDTTGDAIADMQIKLNGLFTLRSGNFNLARSAADATSTLPDLFSTNNDSVDFNDIGTLAGYSSASVYDALDGNDTITLPENIIDAKLIGFDVSKTFHGGAGNDVIIGGSMNDIMAGDAGNDTLYGNHGDDTYIITDEDDAVIENADEGTDLVKASVDCILSNNVENLTLTDGSANGGTTALKGTGNALANTITGNAGNNILDGGAGVDKLIGGAGDDTYIVDLQVRDIYSGNIYMGSYLVLEDSVVEAKNAGNDTFVLRGNAPGGYAFTLVDNIENLDAQSVIRVDGQSSAGINLYGNALDNRIWGNNDGNIINGGAGNDMLYGGDGEDTLDGGEGVNTMAGGKGSDTYIIRNSSDVIYELPSDNGVDHIFTFVSINLDLFQGIEYAEVYDGAQNVVITRSTGNTYSGSNGNDTLTGSNGNDTFLSSSGNDVMTGGLGADTFVWSLWDKSVRGKPAIDTITDFNLAEDTLDLDALLDDKATSENLQNYLDITTSVTKGVTNTEIRISITGGFTGGNYSSSAENHHITLTGVNLLSGTNEAVLIQNLFN